MISPFTGKEMLLKHEPRQLEFRKEPFEVQYHFYLCEDTGEQFTTGDLDELNLTQLYNQYRVKHKLPFPEEITAIRESYGLSAKKMSEILGFGVNSYRNYESGEMPSQANARLIQLAADPAKFLDLVEMTDVLTQKEVDKISKPIRDRISKVEEDEFFFFGLNQYLMGALKCDIYSGFKKPDLTKFGEMVKFFSEAMEPFKTKLNKLLFYADFLHYRNTGYSISGMRYCAIDMGPVPNNFQSLFENLSNNGIINIETTAFKKLIGEQFKPVKGKPFQSELFSETELKALQQVSETFRSCKTQEIIQRSHNEEAWLKNVEQKGMISYDEAFGLKEVS